MSTIPRLSLRGSPLDPVWLYLNLWLPQIQKLSDPPCAASPRRHLLLLHRRSGCQHPPGNYSGFHKFNIARFHKQNLPILLLLSKLCRFKQILLNLYISRPKSWASFLACDLCSHIQPCTSKGPEPALMPDCHRLKILNKFWTRNPAFSFCTGPYKLCSQSFHRV